MPETKIEEPVMSEGDKTPENIIIILGDRINVKELWTEPNNESNPIWRNLVEKTANVARGSEWDTITQRAWKQDQF